MMAMPLPPKFAMQSATLRGMFPETPVASEDVSCVIATATALFGCLGKKHTEAL
jgi:hypothetical protein